MQETIRIIVRCALLLCAAVVALGLGPASAQEFRNADGVAVIIGNENYLHQNADGSTVEAVRYAHRDAKAFKQYVLDVLGFDPRNVIFKLDANKITMEHVFGNRQTHKGQLWRSLAHSSDVVVFYSGHGAPGVDDKSAYLLPVDADPGDAEIGGYPVNVLYENLGKLPNPRSVHVYLDSCFSGNTHAGMLIRNIKGPMNIEPKEPESRVTILSAASAGQVAHWDDTVQHSLFTHHLLNALYGEGDADRDGHVTASEAKGYLDRYMTVAARRSLGRIQDALLQGPSDAVLGPVPPGERPLSVIGTLTVRTEPANAQVRVITSSGSAYRDDMLLAPGQYEVAVEAENYEPFRKSLSINGSTTYRISLCRLETRTKQVCHDRPVTRHRAESRKTTGNIDETESIDLQGYLETRGVTRRDMPGAIENLKRTIADNSHKRGRVRDIMCGIARKRLTNRMGGHTEEHRMSRCRAHGGSYVQGSYGEPACSPCDDILSGQCIARAFWSCSYTKSVQVPYSDTERECSDKKSTERICPRGGTEAVVTLLR